MGGYGCGWCQCSACLFFNHGCFVVLRHDNFQYFIGFSYLVFEDFSIEQAQCMLSFREAHEQISNFCGIFKFESDDHCHSGGPSPMCQAQWNLMEMKYAGVWKGTLKGRVVLKGVLGPMVWHSECWGQAI